MSDGVVLDMADVHLYGNAASAFSKLQAVKAVAGPHFGLLHTDHSENPAAPLMRRLNAGSPPSTDFNNGFEESDSAGLPLLWRLYQRPCASFKPPACGYQAEFAQDTSVSHTGGASARIRNGVSNPAGTPAFYLSPPQPTLPGHIYTLTAYAKGQEVSGSARKHQLVR